MYESTSRHCRPPPNQTPRAVLSGATNASLSASARSRVCSTVTCETPNDRSKARFDRSRSSVSGSDSVAVGIRTISASGPPASVTKARTAAGFCPPPSITSVPERGPTAVSGWASNARQSVARSVMNVSR